MKWFTNCNTVEDAKRQYRKLAMEHHPDQGGSADTFKEIQRELEGILTGFIQTGMDDFEKERGFAPNAEAEVFADMIAKVIDLNITLEIIGYWIYAFDAFEVKDKLKELGFWFSSKHKAWIYSGGKKRKRRSKMTLDDIRGYHGSHKLREREEREKVEA